VRIRCWEDFVLSEGTTSYITARAVEATQGAAAGTALWASYRERLNAAVAGGNTMAWPTGCNAIDIVNDPLWSDIPYMKGAFFLLAVEKQVGRAALDRALEAFFQKHVGEAVGVGDLLDTIQAETGYDAARLANSWLRSLTVPVI
jgi:aminopeptidase N